MICALHPSPNMSMRHLKRAARLTVDHVAALSGTLAWAERSMHGRLTILTYHRVLPDALCSEYLLPSLAVPESLFRAQVRVLASRYKVVRLSDGLASLNVGGVTDRPMVSITFDDGYADNFRIAAPIMNAFDMPATFFVVSGLIGTSDELWYDVAARQWSAASAGALHDAAQAAGTDVPWTSKRKPPIGGWMSFLKRIGIDARYAVVANLADPGCEPKREVFDRLMTPDELRGLRASGHEIGSHTLTHPLLPQLSDSMLEFELTESRRLIEGWLGESISGFCYPNGDLDERVMSATARAGYTHACVTRPGDNAVGDDPLQLRRVDMNPSRSQGTDERFDEPSFRASISRLHEFRR